MYPCAYNTVQINEHTVFFPQNLFTITSWFNRKYNAEHVFKARLQIQLAETANTMCAASGSMPCTPEHFYKVILP